MDPVGRFLTSPSGSFFLFGPRGTGKSTWLRSRFPDSTVVDLLAPDAQRRLAARPEALAETVRAAPSDKPFIIDEIQKVPELLDVVHLLIEERRGRRFILTGSSARKLKRGGADLLAGRASVSRLHPFLASELGERFDLGDALRNGLLPVVWSSRDRERSLQAYVDLYMREEIQTEGLTRSLGTFARFLETISFSQAGLLNLSAIARDAQAGRKAVEAYVGILEDLLLAFRIPVFARRARRKITTHPKFFFADTGIFRALRPAGPLDRREEIEGQAIEGLVAQHLRAWIDYRGGKDHLHFWRTQAGSEVDLVLYGESGIWGVEVKNSGRVRDEDLRNLRGFLEEYPSARGILLHRGTERALRGGILVTPCAPFLTALRPDRSMEDAAETA
ncbi:MAG: ATP-binding protein [Planctomycetes bacterium]|nr:ATP-binding protein [Planctomycetota bacterium]